MEQNILTNKIKDDLVPEITKPETIDISKICDSTNLSDVIRFVDKHTLIDNAGIFGNINDFLNTPVPDNESDKKILTKIGLSLLNDFNKMFNIAESGVDAVLTKYSICRGQILIQLKKLVKRAGQSWGAWATKEIPLLSERVRIDNMRLAYRQDCYNYFPLGSERLLLLIRATEGYKGNDKIGDCMRKYGIKFNPESREQLKNFKTLVDAAINTEKLEKALENSSIKAKPQIVKSLTRFIPSLDNNLLMKTKAIGESEGDVNIYFEKLIINKGKEKSPFEITRSIADFNSSGAKLIQIIDYILMNEDTIETIDTKIFTRLQGKMGDLKTFANIKEEEKKND